MDPVLTPEMGYDRLAHYYLACPECGRELDRDGGHYLARHPERIRQAKLGVRVSQLNISAIPLEEIVGAWYAAFEDPSGNALSAFWCDRLAIPNAGAAQPITQAVLGECRRLGLGESAEAAQPYAMSLLAGSRRPEAADARLPIAARLSGSTELAEVSPKSNSQGPPSGAGSSCVPGRSPYRVAGMDMGPRCWFWCDEVRGPRVSACVWAELIASGNAPARVPLLMEALGISCLLLDAGGEPDLTKRLVLALNGLEDYQPPPLPRHELVSGGIARMGWGLAWDGRQGRWQGLRAAAVLFVAGHARGIQETVGFTQEGRVYPLIKCNRSESIQTAVNDFLTPAQGVIEVISTADQPPTGNGQLAKPAVEGGQSSVVRSLPRARLPGTYIGPGVSQAVLDGHLLNLRKEAGSRGGTEEWIEGVENHGPVLE